MKHLTTDQLKKLTPQRRKALLRSVTAQLAKNGLTVIASKVDYRKQIRRLVGNDGIKKSVKA